MDNKNEQKKVLDFLIRTAEGIAKMFGPSCETLIHDMSKPGHPIVVLYNPHVSGRHVGSTEDIYGVNLVADGDTRHFKLERDIVNSSVVAKNGHYVKSTTLNYVGKDFHYALGINFDYTALQGAMATLEGLTNIGRELNEEIIDSSNSQLEEIFRDCLSLLGKPVEAMKKSDRMQLVALLMQRNAFSFQRAVTYIAEQMKVSRYTLYKYCHELEGTIQAL